MEPCRRTPRSVDRSSGKKKGKNNMVGVDPKRRKVISRRQKESLECLAGTENVGDEGVTGTRGGEETLSEKLSGFFARCRGVSRGKTHPQGFPTDGRPSTNERRITSQAPPVRTKLRRQKGPQASRQETKRWGC